MVPRVRHIDVASSVDSDASRTSELAIPGPPCSPRREEFPGTIELLDAVIASIYCVDVTGSISRNIIHRRKPAVSPSPRCEEIPGTIELLDAIIP
jgi:hypothetical protein